MINIKKSYKLIAKNKKAYFDYEIIDNWEWAIELKGFELKSIRAWHVNLKSSFISVLNNVLIVKWMHISPLNKLSDNNLIFTKRERKIFLHKKTISYLAWKSKESGLSIIPLEIYLVWSLIKIKVWLAKWKKKFEKKQILKERAVDKEARIMMKRVYW